jgi:hypothetical protein
MGPWAGAIYGVIRAVPALVKLFNQVIDLYYQELDRSESEASSKVRKEREALIASLKLDGLTAEHRAIIRRRLYELQHA